MLLSVLLVSIGGILLTFHVQVQVQAGRVVGGSQVQAGALPFQVAVLWRGQIVCGGTIIDTSTILTAAHCVQNPNTAFYSVRAGSLARSGAGPWTQARPVSRIMAHPGFNLNTAINDVAIIKLAQPFVFNAYVNRASLAGPGQRSESAGSTATVSGWGATGFQGQGSPTLLSASLTILPPSTCRSHLQGVVAGGFKEQSMICAGAPGRSPCIGDSGGPLSSFPGNIVVGVVSFGRNCDGPAAFTRVSAFRAWILATAGI